MFKNIFCLDWNTFKERNWVGPEGPKMQKVQKSFKSVKVMHWKISRQIFSSFIRVPLSDRVSLPSLLLSVRKFRTARQRASYPKEIFPLEIVLRHHHHIHDSSKKIQSLATLVKCHFHGFLLKKKNPPNWRFWRFSVATLAKNPANLVILAIFCG